MRDYSIIVKTGEAEIRAIANTEKNILNQLLPIIEITRGRKVTKEAKDSYPFDKRLAQLKESFKGQTVAFDLTSDEALLSDEINELYNPEYGYQKWIDFLVKIKEENIFSEIIPTILLNTDDENFDENLLTQVRKLKSNFSTILYRNYILDEGCYTDFKLLKEELQQTNLYVMVDCGYTPQSTQNEFSAKAIARIKNIQAILDNAKYIICATSFPNNVSDMGDVDNDTYNISEIQIWNDIKKEIPNVIYGDYGSINTKRNDTITMARGWIPRIDVPLQDCIYYYRQRRPNGVSAYAPTYIQVAKLVCGDSHYPKKMNENWGIQQINFCANGNVPSSAPRFWISVRMNIHIEQQVRRLKLLNK